MNDVTAAVSPFRTFIIDGRTTTDTTHRTPLIEAVTPIAGRSFLDVGACDGYEARALAVRGASRVVAIEGKEALWRQAADAAKQLGLANHRVVLGDIREIERHGLGVFDCVCCFGVLYHMLNPYNLLKRLAHMTSDLLLLETHIAPSPWAESSLLPKHRGALLGGVRALYLDGSRFEGRLCPHLGEHKISTGSLDESHTFWLTPSSLAKALTRAGFVIVAWHHDIDAQTDSAIAKQGRDLGFGHANTKIFVVARVDPSRRQPIAAGTVSRSPDAIVSPDFSPTWRDRLSRQAGRVRRLLRR